jgi:hypothetical protein
MRMLLSPVLGQDVKRSVKTHVDAMLMVLQKLVKNHQIGVVLCLVRVVKLVGKQVLLFI